MSDTYDARRARYGGLDFVAIGSGWLVSVALPVLLAGLAVVLAAGVGISTDVSREDAQARAEAIGLIAGALMLVLVALGYFAGGYVAGRMTRFDAALQGVGVWGFSLLAVMAVTVAGAILGTRDAIPGLPALALSAGALDARGVFAFAVVAVATLFLAFLGARSGQRYHQRYQGRLAG